MYCATLCSSYL